MILNKKGVIEQFSLVVYPVDFVVVIGDFEEEVNELYIPYDEGYEGATIRKPQFTAGTYRVKNKETQTPCIMVWVKEKEDCTSSIISHECGHAALEIWKYIRSEVSLTNQEPFCYLLGNLVRLAVGAFYEIPGVLPPVIKQDAFCNPKKVKREKTKAKKK